MSLGVGSLVIGQEPDSSYIKAGESAYQIAVRKGFVGTESDWLQSLQGAGRAYSGAVPPGAPIIGDLWWDTINKRLYVYQTSNWAEVNGNNDEFPVVDLDANAYIAAVEAADTAAGFTGGLEQAVKDAFTMFIVNAKLDGIWSAIKASCIMAGARTLAGALTPLAGVAPTNINFTPADYDRKTGLKGDGSSKYVKSNLTTIPTLPRDNSHIYAYSSIPPTKDSSTYIGTLRYSGAFFIRARTTYTDSRLPGTGDWNIGGGSPSVGGFGITMQSFTPIAGTSNYTLTGQRSVESVVSNYSLTVDGSYQNSSIHILAGGNITGAAGDYSDGSVSFYSIGEGIDLAKLNSRISTLMSQLNTAIV